MEIRSCINCKYRNRKGTEEPCDSCRFGNGAQNFPNKFEPKENICMKCGAIIPEGRHICLTCESTNEMQTFKGMETPETTNAKPPKDAVNHPAHYQGKHECIDEMISLFGLDAVKGFCMCNVYKYRYRASRKNGAEDIAKADWYMDKLIELQQGDSGNE